MGALSSKAYHVLQHLLRLDIICSPRSQDAAPLRELPSFKIIPGLSRQNRALFTASGHPLGQKRPSRTIIQFYLSFMQGLFIPQTSTQFNVEPLLHISSNSPMSWQFSHPEAIKNTHRVTAANIETSAHFLISDQPRLRL